MTSQPGLGSGEFVDQFEDGNYLAIYDDSLDLGSNRRKYRL